MVASANGEERVVKALLSFKNIEVNAQDEV
jgi:hypothetical protein